MYTIAIYQIGFLLPVYQCDYECPHCQSTCLLSVIFIVLWLINIFTDIGRRSLTRDFVQKFLFFLLECPKRHRYFVGDLSIVLY